MPADLTRRSAASEDNNARVDAESDLDRHTVDEAKDHTISARDSELTDYASESRRNGRRSSHLTRMQLLGENDYRDLNERYGHIFRAGMGAKAVREIVVNTDLDELSRTSHEILIATGSAQRRKKATKRLRVVEAFRKAETGRSG